MARLPRTLVRLAASVAAPPAVAVAGLPTWCGVVAALAAVALCVLDTVVTQVLRLRAGAHITERTALGVLDLEDGARAPDARRSRPRRLAAHTARSARAT